jgi:hypothetical protein
MAFSNGLGGKDVTARHRLKNVEGFEALMRFIFPVSPTIQRFNGLTLSRCRKTY